MYRQTFWGLLALAGTEEAVPPWRVDGKRHVVEVLPAQVLRLVRSGCRYKGRDAAAGR